ncbi:phosphatase 2C-like domain-containing protein [Pisolithus croceorrhizus]|nr:phosphatase 2C-like domain-containing protein [Pisolithus croceorrhizus]KAI6125262.1 phosphatase 2C-like domain-containing protein [Pisolithus croceorrhizus]
MLAGPGSSAQQKEAQSSSVASYDEIPGSICGPEDGPWPRAFTNLTTSEAWDKLSLTSDPQSLAYGTGEEWRADALNFQPFPGAKSQDRYAMQQLHIGGRIWTLTAVFDGHLGDATVQHAAYHVPIIVREFLEDLDKKHGGRVVPPPLVADVFSGAIRAFDDAIANDVLELFPGGLDAAMEMPDQQIHSILNDQSVGGKNFERARLCMYGTTALVALVDPDHTNLWLANLGDCQGVMVSETAPQVWSYEILTRVHNGQNKREVERVKREHPGEAECIVDGRVLGAIAPFRCLGDTPFKQPPEFTRRFLYNLFPGSNDTSLWEEFLVRNKTPPYISAMPEVTHFPLDRLQRPLRRYLILCSDGFTDICGKHQRCVINRWLRTMPVAGDPSSTIPIPPNRALQLLWQGLGGDSVSVSKALTLDLDVPWLDDITVVVQTL